MINKLELDIPSMNLMEYIGVIESLYIPEPTIIESPYCIDVKNILTAEDFERIKNVPFGITMCMEIFADRYNNDSFIKQFTYEEYINHKEIQQLIEHLELDVDKFWLLILFVFDYSTSLLYQGQTIKLTALEQLQLLVKTIGVADENMTISFKSDKLKVEIDSSDAIKFIADAITEHAKTKDINEFRDLNKKIAAEESKVVCDSSFYAYFGKMFLRFFSSQPQIRAKRRKGANHSLKEMELVSLLIYFTKISREEGWYCPKEKYLKSFLKQYKNYKYPNNISRVYPDFYI